MHHTQIWILVKKIMTYERAVAQIIVATVRGLVYKDGKDNNQGVLP
jgi:hypothetical protein